MTASVHYATGSSSLGAVLVATAGRKLVWVALDEDPRALVAELINALPAARAAPSGALDEAVARVIARIESPTSAATATSPRLDLEALKATAFQRRVWEALLAIPVGRTTTYGALAASLGLPATAVRALGQAIAKNPVAVLIPCHRVLRADGALAGYRWGLSRKARLLVREGAIPESLRLDFSP